MDPVARALQVVNAKLDRVIHLLQTLYLQGVAMSAELDALTAQVKANTDAEASAVTLINGIADQIAAAVANASMSADDKKSLVALTTNLKGSADALAAAVVANTPAAKPAS